MKPVNSEKYGYHFGVPTSYSKFHLGLDIIAKVGEPVYAPELGRIAWITTGTQGGKTIHFRGRSGVLHRFLHLSAYGTTGEYKEGELIGRVGNTGSLSSGPHLHWDISKNGVVQLNNINNFLDPLMWGEPTMVNKDNINGLLYAVTGLTNNKNTQEIADALNKGDQAEVNKLCAWIRVEMDKVQKLKEIINA